MTSSPRNLLLLGAAAAALGVPSAARAETFCVGPVDCPAGGISKGDDLQAALKASGKLSLDTILVADKGSPYVGPFVFEARSQQGGEPQPPLVAIKGVGASRPKLTGPSGRTVVSLSRATLSGVEVVRPNRTTPGVGALDATLTDVEVTEAAAEGPGGIGVLAGGFTKLVDTWVDSTGDTGFVVSPGSVVEATGIHTQGTEVGVRVAGTSRFRLERSRIEGAVGAIAGKGDTEVRRSTLVTSDLGAIGIKQADGRLLLDHVTIAHRDQRSSAPAIDLDATVPTQATLRAVAMGGYARGLRRTVTGSGAYAITAIDSVWDASADELPAASGGPGVRLGGLDAEPRFADRAGGDLRPAAGAPQIDLDRSTDADYRDLTGAPASDGDGDGLARADAGALELTVPSAPKPSGAPAPGTQEVPAPSPAPVPASASRAAATAPKADTRAPKLSRLRLTKGLRLTFRVDEAATIRIRSGKLTLVRKVTAGTRSIALRGALKRRGLLRRSALRITVTAADAAGNRTTTKALRRTLRKG